ncbi:MAG: 2-keto-4-pentenoate hydratase, partial [SAR324 cluster bacterium]|nr:2-keto-4-pentenoate hydratase [SAR324 cluster bacterium]
AEVRMLEIIADGKPKTEFMKFGDCVKIEMRDSQGETIFGEIKQEVKPYHG